MLHPSNLVSSQPVIKIVSSKSRNKSLTCFLERKHFETVKGQNQGKNISQRGGQCVEEGKFTILNKFSGFRIFVEF